MQNVLALQSMDVETVDAADAELFWSAVSILCCVVGTDLAKFAVKS